MDLCLLHTYTHTHTDAYTHTVSYKSSMNIYEMNHWIIERFEIEPVKVQHYACEYLKSKWAKNHHLHTSAGFDGFTKYTQGHTHTLQTNNHTCTQHFNYNISHIALFCEPFQQCRSSFFLNTAVQLLKNSCFHGLCLRAMLMKFSAHWKNLLKKSAIPSIAWAWLQDLMRLHQLFNLKVSQGVPLKVGTPHIFLSKDNDILPWKISQLMLSSQNTLLNPSKTIDWP